MMKRTLAAAAEPNWRVSPGLSSPRVMRVPLRKVPCKLLRSTRV